MVTHEKVMVTNGRVFLLLCFLNMIIERVMVTNGRVASTVAEQLQWRHLQKKTGPITSENYFVLNFLNNTSSLHIINLITHLV